MENPEGYARDLAILVHDQVTEPIIDVDAWVRACAELAEAYGMETETVREQAEAGVQDWLGELS